MTNVIELEQFLNEARRAEFNDLNSATDAIASLADALDTFAAELHAYGERLSLQTQAQDQDRMLDAWHSMCDGLRSILRAPEAQTRAVKGASPR